MYHVNLFPDRASSPDAFGFGFFMRSRYVGTHLRIIFYTADGPDGTREIKEPPETALMISDMDYIPLERARLGAGLDRIQEAVISSHFMHKLVALNSELDLYDEGQFKAKTLNIDAQTTYETLVPSILRACPPFIAKRVLAAKGRAKERHRRYGLANPRRIGLAELYGGDVRSPVPAGTKGELLEGAHPRKG